MIFAHLLMASIVALGGPAAADPLKNVQSLSDDRAFDKYPNAAITPDGTLWVAWTSTSQGADRILLRRRSASSWSAPERLDEGQGIESGVRLAVGPDGVLSAIWSGRRDGLWSVFLRRRTGQDWGREERLSTAQTDALHPVLAADRQGRLWAAWEEAKEGAGRFTLAWTFHDGDAWQRPRSISGAGSDRRPDLAACEDGSIFLAWDSTRSGNYDIWLADLTQPRLEPRAVTRWAGIDDSPSLACSSGNALWIAFNSMRSHQNEELRVDRHSGEAFVRVLKKGRLSAPRATIAGGLPGQVSFGMVNKTPRNTVDPYWQWKQTQNYPRAFHDGRGIWIIWRTDETGAHNFDLHARYHDGRSWSLLQRLTVFSPGRDEWPSAVATAPGKLLLTWEGQELPRPGQEGRFGGGDVDAYNTKANRNVVLIAELNAPTGRGVRTPVRRVDPDVFRAEEGGESPARGPSKGGVVIEGRRERIFFGDPHTHSILSDSKTGLPDQILFLSRDAVGLDFAVVSDHSEMGLLQPSEFAELQLTARTFDQAGQFVSLSGWEWTAGVRYGHRVALFKDDGGPPLSADRPEGDRIEELYDHLRRHDGIVSPHHSANAAWGRWNPEAHYDPDLEPNFEIASWHGRYEFYGNPWEGRRQVPGHQYQDALRRGRRVGVMAASDTHHLSPGEGGLTAILAPRLDRESLFEALRRRRNYATTGAKIVLGFRVEGRLMGSHFTHRGPLHLRVKVRGTAAVDRVEIVRDLVDTFAAVRLEQDPQSTAGRFIVYEPRDAQGGRTVDSDDTSQIGFEVVDEDESAGIHSYYVRVTQADGQQAWSSPVWVTRESP